LYSYLHLLSSHARGWERRIAIQPPMCSDVLTNCFKWAIVHKHGCDACPRYSPIDKPYNSNGATFSRHTMYHFLGQPGPWESWYHPHSALIRTSGARKARTRCLRERKERRKGFLIVARIAHDTHELQCRSLRAPRMRKKLGMIDRYHNESRV